jgi:hypothetical protein
MNLQILEIRAQRLFSVLMLALLTGLCGTALTSAQERPDPPATSSGTPLDQAGQEPSAAPRKLFDGKTLSNWEVVGFGGQEQIEVAGGAIVADAGYPLAGIASTLDDLPKSGYTLSLEAKKIEGTDFFCCVTFPVGQQYCSFVVGGWGGTLCGISCINGDDAAHNATRTLKKFERDRWYAIEISVGDDRVVCKIDGEVAVDLPRQGAELGLRSEVLVTTPMGLCAFETKSAWRNICLTCHVPGEKAGK